ncbi:MAG: glycosyltransferase [Oscillospiraceae bacterium]|nr:glycosyltransferase [Oscillospiraceae bacterium]
MAEKKKLRILQVNKAYYPHIGGIESLVRTYAVELMKRPDVQMQVLVCQDKRGKTTHEIIEGVPVTRAGSMGTFASCPLSLSFFRLFRKLSKNADVILFHMPFPLGDLACLLSGFKGRVVLAWHSDVVKQKKLLTFYKPVLKKFLKRADAVVTATKGHIDSSAFLPEFRDKCSVIPYGLNADKYINAPLAPVLSEKLCDKKAVKVLFTGRLVYYKGIDVLLRAFEKVRRCELFIVGTGVLEEELKKSAEKMEQKVHFLGVLSDEELRSAFSDCDIFVLPSVENSEAFGIVQLEAMVYGKPVINTALPTGVPFVSLHEETGLTVPPKDSDALAKAINYLAENRDIREKYGKAGFLRVKNEFDEKKVLDRLYDVLKKGVIE